VHPVDEGEVQDGTAGVVAERRAPASQIAERVPSAAQMDDRIVAREEVVARGADEMQVAARGVVIRKPGSMAMLGDRESDRLRPSLTPISR